LLKPTRKKPQEDLRDYSSTIKKRERQRDLNGEMLKASIRGEPFWAFKRPKKRFCLYKNTEEEEGERKKPVSIVAQPRRSHTAPVYHA
jgi:hypothetical protein